jgi:hypothetical protein
MAIRIAIRALSFGLWVLLGLGALCAPMRTGKQDAMLRRHMDPWRAIIREMRLE